METPQLPQPRQWLARRWMLLALAVVLVLTLPGDHDGQVSPKKSSPTETLYEERPPLPPLDSQAELGEETEPQLKALGYLQ